MKNNELEQQKTDNNIILSELNEDSNEENDIPKEIDVLFTYYFSGQMLEFPNLSKIILKPQFYAPLGYSLIIASESKIDILSHTQYCIEEQNLYSKVYQVEQGNLEKEKYSLLFKFDFNPTESDTECQFILKTEDKYLYQFLRMKIIDKSSEEIDPTGDGKELSLNQKLCENTSTTTLNS